MVKLSSTEEENTEFLSSLWDTYKYLILLSLVLLGAGIFGWESWSQNRISNLQDSANMYESFINSLNDEDLDQKVLADQIIKKSRLRLARVLIANDNSNKALEIINESKSMSSSLHEVKGDAEEKLGFYAEAKLSYLKALESNQSQSVEAILKMKLANLDT